MGISDVLRDAVEQIEEYQAELPTLYDPVREELAVLKVAMLSMVRRLNTTPSILGKNIILGEKGTL